MIFWQQNKHTSDNKHQLIFRKLNLEVMCLRNNNNKIIRSGKVLSNYIILRTHNSLDPLLLVIKSFKWFLIQVQLISGLIPLSVRMKDANNIHNINQVSGQSIWDMHLMCSLVQVIWMGKSIQILLNWGRLKWKIKILQKLLKKTVQCFKM
jgi:hypothetical protein